jgi:small-conductance mechanosensitive channel
VPGSDQFWVSWIPTARIKVFLTLDLFLLLWLLSLAGYAVYRLFLRSISEKRHRNLKRRLTRLLICLGAATLWAAAFWALREIPGFDTQPWVKFSAYSGLFALFFESLSIVWVAQLYVYLFLFLKNTQRGVPRLLANIFTLLFFLTVFSFVGTYVFGFKIAPVLATSAVFSVIIGLALQDTLGSLFAGLSLQLEQPFRLGDWVEVQNGGQRWSGQIQEVNWRATFLLGYSDELIVIPNKVLAASQILVFTYESRPGRRSQAFRLPAENDPEAVKKALLAGLRDVPAVLSYPAPKVLVTETGEAWLTYKQFYCIEDFGAQFSVGDAVIGASLARLKEAGFSLAEPRLAIRSESAT